MGEPLTYAAQVDEWVMGRLGYAKTFAELVIQLPGVYPTIIAESLTRLRVSLPRGDSETLIRLPGPVPHPVDGDWRFHPNSHEAIAERLRKDGVREVAILASPSLVEPLHGSFDSIALADANVEWDPYLSFSNLETCWGDVASAVHKWPARFECAIADPPWYAYEFRRFLSVAAGILTSGGKLLLCWPPEGARPGIKGERTRLLQSARTVGLRFLEHRRLFLRYATPFYEARALQAAGLPVLAAWRRADLITFIREGTAYTADIEPTRETWAAARYRSLNIRIRQSPCLIGTVDPRLSQLIKGDVLPTVSQRDGRRRAAIAWTAGNRIFDCKRPDLLLRIVRRLSEGQACLAVEEMIGRQLEALEKQWTLETEHQLRSLEACEAFEYDALHDTCATCQ